MPLHRILFIDAYDSFSNSIISLLRSELSVTVDCIKIDDPRFVLNDEAFFNYLDGFDAVVAGPGPGHPSKAEDVGLIAKLWSLPDDHILPVLGICLGFQSLCLAFGAQVERLREPRHGILSMLTHRGKDIFADTGKIVATQYHSLHVQIGNGGEVFWEPTQRSPNLIPLAWDLMNVSNGPILMAVRHRELPFWGVQYHPESICTNKQGQKLIGKWWEHVKTWQDGRSRKYNTTANVYGVTDVEIKPLMENGGSTRQVQWRALESTQSVDVAALMDLLRERDPEHEPLLLESGSRNGKPVNPETGRFSIIGLPDSSCEQIRYYTSTGLLERSACGHVVSSKAATVKQAFASLDALVKEGQATNGPEELPFWGGPIGYVSYEAGLETIGVQPSGTCADRPDIWFVFVRRSVVIDHKGKGVYLQSLNQADDDWLADTQRILQGHSETSAEVLPEKMPTEHRATVLREPQQDAYCQKVLACQSQLRAGESYELCLTDQSIVSTPETSWSMYRRLRTRNPAPFGAFLQFSPSTGPDLGSAKERAENLMIVDLIRHDLSGVKG
jgi:para-aminobenzoate synthetase